MSMYAPRVAAASDSGHAAGEGSGVPWSPSTSAGAEREQSMKEHAIGFDGLRYDYHGYRYDRLADALAYARLMCSRPAEANPFGAYRTGPPITGPSDEDRKLMTALAIRYEDGTYRFGTFRCDRLADASSYARLVGQRKRDAGGVMER